MKCAFIRELKLLYLKIKLRWKYRERFILHKKCILLGEKTLNRPLVWKEQDNFSKLCICVLAVNLTRMQSIYALCRGGLTRDAIILLRVMFEDLMNLNYMREDKTRIQDFIDFYSRLRLDLCKMLEEWDKISDPQKWKQERMKLQNLWDSVKQKFIYTDKNGKQRIFKDWRRGKNLEQISKELGAEEIYNPLYRYLSNYVHTTPIVFNDYVSGMDKNMLGVEPGVNEKFVPEAMRISSVLFLDVLLKAISQEYSLGIEKEIEKLVKKIEAFPPSDYANI